MFLGMYFIFSQKSTIFYGVICWAYLVSCNGFMFILFVLLFSLQVQFVALCHKQRACNMAGFADKTRFFSSYLTRFEQIYCIESLRNTPNLPQKMLIDSATFNSRNGYQFAD